MLGRSRKALESRKRHQLNECLARLFSAPCRVERADLLLEMVRDRWR